MTINPALSIIDAALASGSPTAKFPDVGDKIVGTIADIEERQKTAFGTNEPEYYSDGRPMMEWVIALAETETNDEDTGDLRVFASGRMLTAIKQAIVAAGAPSNKVLGGRLAIQYYADGEPSRPGYNPPKLYRAQLQPATNAAVDSLLAAPATQTAPEAAQAAPEGVQGQPEASAAAEDLFG